MSSRSFNIETIFIFSATLRLNSLESIDILDSMCSHIRLDYLNNKLMRILPIYNKEINEDWITNKIRFVYDSNLYQRLNYPLIKVNNSFINISWINAFNLFFISLYKYINKNVVLGSFSDYDSILNIKQFFNLLGTNIFFESNINDFNSDFLNDIYTSLNLENTKILLMVSLNLRLEMPILNSKLLRKKEKILFYSIGNVGYFYSNYFKYLGNNVLDIINFVYGRTILNKELFNNFSFDLNVFNQKFKPNGLQVLIGQSFYFIKNSFMLYNIIKKYVNNNYIFSWCNNLFSNVGILNYLNINHLKKFIFNNKDSSMYFLNNIDNYYFLKNIKKENNFIVYRGSFFDEGAKYSDLIFPSTTFFEENLNYKSFEGINVNTRKVVSTNFYNNKEFFFFFNMLKLKFFKSNLFSIINFKVVLKYFKFLYINFNNINFVFDRNLLFKSNQLNNYKFFIENKIFNSIIINYYKTDVYSRNSKNISLASLEYLKTIITYIK